MSIRHSATNKPLVNHDPVETDLAFRILSSCWYFSLCHGHFLSSSCKRSLLSALQLYTSFFQSIRSAALTSHPLFLSLVPLLAQDFSRELPQKQHWRGNEEKSSNSNKEEWSLWNCCCQNRLKISDSRDMFWNWNGLSLRHHDSYLGL